MGFEATISNWILLYIAELLSFSLALIFMVKSELQRPILYWISSNILAALSVLTPPNFIQPNPSGSLLAPSLICTAVSNLLAYFSVNYGQRLSLTKNLIISVIFVLWIISASMPYSAESALLAYFAAALLVTVTAWAAYKNRLFHGMMGHALLVVGFLLCATLIMWRGLLVFLADWSIQGFVLNRSDAALSIQLLVLVSFLMQISFISVVVARDLRRRRLNDRRAAREFEITQGILAEQRQAEIQSEDRLDLIGLLTHDVRQPISNAQAALEALEAEVGQSDVAANEVREAISRARTVLDGITLSISNAILGVSLIDQRHAIQTSTVDARQLAELSLSDCPIELRQRVRISSPEGIVFVDLDPVVGRLALRNLFDNALKYSKPRSIVDLHIGYDEDRLGVSFKFTNEIDGPSPNENIFDRRVRANLGNVEGSGHGLFLVNKVAFIHNGSVNFYINEDGRITFNLFIPD